MSDTVLTRAEKDRVPCCPICGEPARSISCVRTVRVEVRVEHGRLVETGTKYLGKKYHSTPEYECGGKHRWTKED